MAAKNDSKSTKILIIFLAILFVVIIAVIIINKFSDTVPKNPEGTVGNTAGNIYNSGLFCEDGQKIYFANVYDQYSLYSMNPDQTDVKKLVSAKVKYINAGGDYLYYYMTDSTTASGLGFIRRVMGIYRCKKNGKAVQTITRDPSLEMILAGNDIYYQHYDNKTAVNLHKISTDGKTDIKLSTDIINPAGIYDDVIYYSNQNENHFLMILDTANDSTSEYLRYNVWNPIRQGNYIYFLDIQNNYRLARYNMSDGSIELLSKERVDCFNLNTEYIFYQTNDSENPLLKRMSIDGSTDETVLEGNYTSINMTSTYVYFVPFENQEMMYKTPSYGSINVTEFDVARNAAAIN